MIAFVPVKNVAHLPLLLIGKSLAIGVVGRTEGKAADRRSRQDYLRHISAGCQEAVGVGGIGLLAFVIQLAAVLEEQLIADVRGDEAGELGHAVIQLDVISALRVARIAVRGSGLHTAGRIPVEAMIQQAQMLFGVDLIVQLWSIDLLEAGASHRADVPGQGRDLGCPGGDGRSVADLLANRQCASVAVER